MINNIMIAIIAVAAVTSASLGYFTLTRLQSKKREFFLLFIFCVFIYEFGYILEMTATTADGGLVATKIMYLGSELIAPLFLIFVQKYCEKDIGRILNGLFFASAIAVIALVWTSERHTLYYTAYWYDDVSEVHHLGIERGILYPFGLFHPVVCSFFSLKLLVQQMIASDRDKRKRLLIFIFSSLAPVFSHILYFLNLNPFGVNYAPVFLMVSMILLYFGVFKYDLLENEETIRSQNWLKDMIGNISHDLKTPLTVLGQYLEILDDNTITMDEIERPDYTHIAYNKNLNLQRLIRNLFEITRIESSQLVYNLEYQSAEEIASDLRDKYAKFLANMGLSFSVSCDTPCLIRLDKDKIWSVFNNIIFNAIRHTPRGGSISVTIRYSLNSTEADGSGGIASGICTITIADTGEGIEKQHLPRLFERFYKASRARNTGDSGIGLYIAQTNVHNMGGNISVESEPNKGTAFAITLAAKEKR